MPLEYLSLSSDKTINPVAGSPRVENGRRRMESESGGVRGNSAPKCSHSELWDARNGQAQFKFNRLQLGWDNSQTVMQDQRDGSKG